MNLLFFFPAGTVSTVRCERFSQLAADWCSRWLPSNGAAYKYFEFLSLAGIGIGSFFGVYQSTFLAVACCSFAAVARFAGFSRKYLDLPNGMPFQETMLLRRVFPKKGGNQRTPNRHRHMCVFLFHRCRSPSDSEHMRSPTKTAQDGVRAV